MIPEIANIIFKVGITILVIYHQAEIENLVGTVFGLEFGALFKHFPDP